MSSNDWQKLTELALNALADCKRSAEDGSRPPSARLELVRDYSTPAIALLAAAFKQERKAEQRQERLQAKVATLREQALSAALDAFITTIEATGGLMNIAEDDRPYLVPVADETWADLADAYLLACKAFNRLPKIDEAPNPFSIPPKAIARKEGQP
jgi:hypothetical protein